MVHDHARAEDITQDVFMSALRRMRETERPIIFKPWIYEIAKNACIDAFRRSKRAEEVSFDAEEGLGGSDYGRLVSSTPTPDAAVDTRMSLDHLRGAFGGLSEMHHDILVMRELEGLSYREIGQRLGMSRPSVESTLFRARRRLTEEYEELTSGERCTRVQGLIAESSGRRMGVRDERKLARHVSYCQPCRRAAYAAGFDVAALAAQKSLREKIAAVLPIPAFLKRRWFGGGDHGHGHGAGGGSVAKLSSAASQYAEPMGGWAKAAAVAATVAVAGAGAGVATTHGSDPGSVAPAQKAPAGAGLQPATAAGKRAPGTTSAATRSSAARTTPATASTATRRAGSGARSGGGSAAGGAAAGSSSAKQSPAPSGGSSAKNSAAGGSSASTSGGSSSRSSRPARSGNKTVNKTAGTVHKTAGTVNKTVNKTAGAVNKTANTTAGAVNKTVNKTTGTVSGAVGAVTGAVDKATNGATAPATGAVNGAVGTATNAANGATSTATGVVTGATSTATGAASNPVGTVTGATSNPVGTVTGAVGGVLPGG